jgi:hypothetical protein
MLDVFFCKQKLRREEDMTYIYIYITMLMPSPKRAMLPPLGKSDMACEKFMEEKRRRVGSV